MARNAKETISKSKNSSAEKNPCGESNVCKLEATSQGNEEAMRKGRPKGRKNYASVRLWQPTKWHPYYDGIVALHVEGATNIFIAAQYNITKEQVSNILNTEEGKRKISELQTAKSAIIHNSLSSRHNRLVEKAFERVEAVLQSDELADTSPFAVFDRALSYLRHTAKEGDLINPEKDAPRTVNVTNNFLVEVKAGLEKIREVAVLHGETDARGLQKASG